MRWMGTGSLSILGPVGTVDPPMTFVLTLSFHQHTHQILDLPDPIRDACRHSWRGPQRQMLATEVVDEVVQGDSVFVVPPFLAKRIGQAGESPIAHSGGQVHAF